MDGGGKQADDDLCTSLARLLHVPNEIGIKRADKAAAVVGPADNLGRDSLRDCFWRSLNSLGARQSLNSGETTTTTTTRGCRFTKLFAHLTLLVWACRLPTVGCLGHWQRSFICILVMQMRAALFSLLGRLAAKQAASNGRGRRFNQVIWRRVHVTVAPKRHVRVTLAAHLDCAD